MSSELPMDNSSLTPGEVTYGIGEIFRETLMQAQNNVHDNGQDEVKLTSTSAPSHYNGCELVEFLITVVLAGISCLLGFTGNLLSIVILRRDPRKSVTLFLLTVLAVADFMFLMPMVVLFVVPGFCRFVPNCNPSLERTLPYIDQYGWAVASMCHTGTVYVVVLVTIHRYISVCKPHDAPRLSTISIARRQVLLVVLFAVVFNIPRFVEFEVENLAKYNGTNGTQVKLEPQRVFTRIGRNVWFQVLYKNIAFYLFMYIIPLFTLVILSSRLARTLQKRHKNRFRMSVRRHQREDNTTFVLIIVVAVFVICQTPTPFQRFFYYIFGDGGRACGHFFFYFERFADYLAVLNSCVNFMIYVIFARGFRQNLTDMCMGQPRSKRVYRVR